MSVNTWKSVYRSSVFKSRSGLTAVMEIVALSHNVGDGWDASGAKRLTSEMQISRFQNVAINVECGACIASASTARMFRN